MRRLNSSVAYGRWKGINGFFFVLMGIAICVQTLHAAGLSVRVLPGLVLGGAMIGLGTMRVRALLAWRPR